LKEEKNPHKLITRNNPLKYNIRSAAIPYKNKGMLGIIGANISKNKLKSLKSFLNKTFFKRYKIERQENPIMNNRCKIENVASSGLKKKYGLYTKR
jgi:hypothetical protein